MKKVIFYEILNALKQNPRLARKLKVFAAAGMLIVLTTGGLAIWAGISAFKYISSTVDQTYNAPTVQRSIESLSLQARSFPKVHTTNCWGKVQSLLSTEPWLVKPAMENLKSLRDTCFEEKRQTKQGKPTFYGRLSYY